MKGLKGKLLVLVMGCGLLIFGSVPSAQASDVANWRNPFLENVERVHVVVDYQIHGVKEEDISPPLRHENLEKMLVKIYTERFSSKDCHKWLGGMNPYSCNDAPVVTWSASRNREDEIEWREKRRKPETLNIIFHIRIRGNESPYGDLKLKEPLAAFYIIQDRYGVDLPVKNSVSTVGIFPANRNRISTKRYLLKFMKYRIN